MNRIREAAMGSDVSEMASRGTRIHLDIEAGSPLLLLPVSSTSNRLIVVHLGFVEASNTFKFSGDDGTISSQTLRNALGNINQFCIFISTHFFSWFQKCNIIKFSLMKT